MTALTPQDHEDIRQLLARYNLAIDLGRIGQWVECFTPDGVFECVGLPDGAPLGGRHEGVDALRAYAETHYGINKGRARHWNWNLLVEAADLGLELTPDQAWRIVAAAAELRDGLKAHPVQHPTLPHVNEI